MSDDNDLDDEDRWVLIRRLVEASGRVERAIHENARSLHDTAFMLQLTEALLAIAEEIAEGRRDSSRPGEPKTFPNKKGE